MEENKVMNDCEIKDLDNVLGDPINSEIELYSAISADDDKEVPPEDSDSNIKGSMDDTIKPSTEVQPADSEEPVTEEDSLDKTTSDENVEKETSKEESTQAEEAKLESETQTDEQETAQKESDDSEEPVTEEDSLDKTASDENVEKETSKEESTQAEEAKLESETQTDEQETAQKESDDSEEPVSEDADKGRIVEIEPAVQLDPKEKAKLAMQTKIVRAVNSDMRKDLPKFRSGDTISVGYRVIEGSRSRVQTFEGVVIKISSGHGLDKTFTVRKISSGVGVERIFPFHSPNIESINILKEGRIRRAKLYYLRNRKGKAARIKERA